MANGLCKLDTIIFLVYFLLYNWGETSPAYIFICEQFMFIIRQSQYNAICLYVCMY